MRLAFARTLAQTLFAVGMAALMTLSTPAQARAAYGYTDIAYVTSQYRLNGFTLTALDWWEPIVGYFEYPPCECIITYVNRVEVDALLYNPVGLELTVPPQIESDGEALVQMSGYWPSRAGNWRGVGLHYLLTDYYYGSQWLGGERAPLGGTQDTENVPCVMPTGETTSSSGWRDDIAWYTVHEFRGHLVPGNGVYTGHSVQEYQPSQGSDGCWAPGLPASYRYALSTPYNPWPVDSNASYSDSIGWYPSGVVTDIRNFRSANGLAMPCDVAVPQQMKMLTCPGAPVYQSHNVTMRIGTTTFQVGRANVTVARTWPVNRAAFLSTEMNQYVAAEGGCNSYLIANRNSIGAWEEFGLEHVVANVYALVVSNGKYVAAVGGGNGDVVADRTQVGPWEQFEMIEQGGDQVVFRTINGQFLRVVPSQGGLIDARGQAPGPWEMFVRVPR